MRIVRRVLPTVIRPRSIPSPVTVLNHNLLSRRIVELSKESKVAKLSTPIELDAVESKIDRGLNITLVVVNVAWTPRRDVGTSLLTAAIISIPDTIESFNSVSTHFQRQNARKFQTREV